MNEIYWMTVIGNLSTVLTVVCYHADCFVGIGR